MNRSRRIGLSSLICSVALVVLVALAGCKSKGGPETDSQRNRTLPQVASTVVSGKVKLDDRPVESIAVMIAGMPGTKVYTDAAGQFSLVVPDEAIDGSQVSIYVEPEWGMGKAETFRLTVVRGVENPPRTLDLVGTGGFPPPSPTEDPEPDF